MHIVYYSMTGQCRRFASKFTSPIWGEENKLVELSPSNPYITMTQPYIIIVPSYEEIEIREIFYDFFETADNINLCIGMIGSGNRNFGDLYLVTAKEMHDLYDIPILYDVEFHGNSRDVTEIEHLLSDIWHQQN